MTSRTARIDAARTVVAGLAVLATVTACSSGSGSKAAPKTTPKTTSSATGSGQRANGFGGFGQLLDDPQAKACLAAAGITLPTRPSGSDRPTGARRSGFPTGQRPSGFPTGQRPSGAPRAGGFGGQDPAQFGKIQAALKACGIALPTTRPRPSGTATPTPSPGASG